MRRSSHDASLTPRQAPRRMQQTDSPARGGVGVAVSTKRYRHIFEQSVESNVLCLIRFACSRRPLHLGGFLRTPLLALALTLTFLAALALALIACALAGHLRVVQKRIEMRPGQSYQHAQREGAPRSQELT